jgi:hypothetical protein
MKRPRLTNSGGWGSKSLFLPILAIFISVFILFCSKKQGKEEITAARLLPEKVEAAGLQRMSPPRTFLGQALWEYLDGGAEIYHQYNFAEVATTDYKGENVELAVDIFRFDNATNAFGLYSTLRPEKPNIALLGVEGFSTPGAIEFVKGAYYVKIISYKETEESNRAMIGLAQELNTLIPGATNKPNSFLLFPINNKLGARDRYYRELFLGQKFLRRFYSQDYALESDTVTLFLSPDESGEKYLKWSEYATALNAFQPASDSLGFDSGRAFIMDDNISGRIVVGLRKGKILGMTGYKEIHKRFLTDWINSLQ